VNGRRVAVVLAAAGLIAAIGVVGARSFDDPDQATNAVPTAQDATAPACRVDDGRSSSAATYRDPTGDAQAGHGDITTVDVSEENDVATIKTVAGGLRDTDAVVVSFDTDCDTKDDFVLRVWNDGSTFLSQLTEEGIPVTDLPASTTRRGSTYTTRFESREIGRATAFRFRVRVDTEEYEVYADFAPDDESSFWTFGGARA
jgi:hypothetical protein